MTWQILSVLPVWLLAIVSAIVIAVTTPSDQFVAWVAIALAATVILTFAIQLATKRPEGFVTRAMAAIGGSVAILAVASGIVALLG